MDIKIVKNIETFIQNKVRPRTRVDGGDIRFEKIENDTLYIGAYADCAVCSCCEPELNLWIKSYIEKELGLDLKIVINKYPPYYY